MSLVGFAVMNPIVTMSMIDVSRWRPVVFADTPKSLNLYQRFVNEKKNDTRRAVLFLIGALNLGKVSKDRARFSSVLVFDDVQNLSAVEAQIKGFCIADITAEGEASFPRHLTPMELADLLEVEGSIPDPTPLLSKVTNALGRRRPSVLETTSRVPMGDGTVESGAQRLLNEVKNILDAEDKVPFSLLLDLYTKYLFRIVERTKITTMVTKKLPEAAKELWKQALTFADSDIGETMAKAYARLCRTSDADYRVGHAVNDFGLKPYSGDFLYFTAVLPPHRNCAFISTFSPEKDESSLPLVSIFKPPALPTTPTKSKAKKARARS